MSSDPTTAPEPTRPPDGPLRDRYLVATEQVENEPGAWNSTSVSVWRRGADGQPVGLVGRYLRDHFTLAKTFEPFRQWRDGAWHDYALISEHYQHTSVMDLATGQIVAAEDPDHDGPIPYGFCPVEFHVPDFWDCYPTGPDGRPRWDLPADTVPGLTGQWGLVAGCHWGDDSAWKVQFLDLSRVADGVLVRDDRFGYVELPAVPLREAVHIPPSGGPLTLAVAVTMDLADGRPDLDGLTRPDWRHFRRPGEKGPVTP